MAQTPAMVVAGQAVAASPAQPMSVVAGIAAKAGGVPVSPLMVMSIGMLLSAAGIAMRRRLK